MGSHSCTGAVLYGRWVRPDQTAIFGEQACLRGALGPFPATDVLPVALATQAGWPLRRLSSDKRLSVANNIGDHATQRAGQSAAPHSGLVRQR
jgi:hypothetical protein